MIEVFEKFEEVSFDDELNLILDKFFHEHLKKLFVKHMEKEMVTRKRNEK